MENLACKVRIHPTKEQERFLRSNIGACRFVWNMLVDLQEYGIIHDRDLNASVNILSEGLRILDTEADTLTEWFRQGTAASARRRNVRGGHMGTLEALGFPPSDEAHSSVHSINARN